MENRNAQARSPDAPTCRLRCRRYRGRHARTEMLPVANSNFTQRRTSMNSQDDLRPRYPMNRRAFVGMEAAGAASTLIQGAPAAQPAPKARNVVLVHGLFADGSSWSEVIARLQAAGLNATA